MTASIDRHVVPASLMKLSEAATPGEFFADGDRYDVYAQPHGSSFLGERAMVARCAVGDDASANAAFVAAAVNFVRLLISLPSGRELAVLAKIAEEDEKDLRHAADGWQVGEDASSMPAMMPHERRRRREDETVRMMRPVADLDVKGLLLSRPDLTSDQAAVLLALGWYVDQDFRQVASRIPGMDAETTVREVLVTLLDADLAYGSMSMWSLTHEGQTAVVERNVALVDS